MRMPVILCLALLLALVGCGGNGGGEAQEAPPSETPAPAGEAAPPDTTSMKMGWNLDDVAGLTWVLDSIVLDGETIDLQPDVTSTFHYSEDGKVDGDAGCNKFSGTVTKHADTGTISLSPLAVTKMSCPGPTGVQETAYLSALSKVDVVKLKGHGLTLATRDGGTVLGFRLLLETE